MYKNCFSATAHFVFSGLLLLTFGGCTGSNVEPTPAGDGTSPTGEQNDMPSTAQPDEPLDNTPGNNDPVDNGPDAITEQPSYPAWDPAVAYFGGTKVTFADQAYEAKWWNLNESPAEFAGGAGLPWLALDEAVATTVSTPTAATQFRAIQLDNQNIISLSWSDQANNEDEFIIQRRLNSGNWQDLSREPENTLTYIDSMVSFGGAYVYRIASSNSIGTSSYVTSNAVNLEQLPTAPDDVSDVIAVASATQTIVGISWTDNADNEQGFIVERRENADAWQQLASVSADVTTYADANISAVNTYLYRVAAFNQTGTGTFLTSQSINIEEIISEGERLFNQHCIACHTEGGIAANLFDGFIQNSWSDSSLSNLLTKIVSMPAPQCDQNCINAVAEFLWVERWGFSINLDHGDQQAGVRGIRKLTPYEFKNTIYSLFAVDVDQQDLPKNHFSSEFKYPTDANNGIYLYDHVNEMIKLVGDITSAINLESLGCSSTDCNGAQLAALTTGIMRRPLTTSELASYEKIRADYGTRDALAAMLLAPDFLYHIEIGDWDIASQSYPLNDYQVANLLSYQLWGTTPSSELLALAATNGLSEISQIETAVDTLLADPKFATHFVDFIAYYLQTNERVSEKPGLTNDVINAMVDEQRLAVQAVASLTDANIDDLFNPGYTFANNTLSTHYGLAAMNSAEMTRVNTDSTRGGILHQGLTQIANADFAATSLVKRGKMIRENMLCHSMGVPSGVNPDTITLPDTAISTRQRWDLITGANASEGQCWQCHQLMNEPGSALENFDQTGKYRLNETAYNDNSVQVMIDSAGELRDNSGQNVLSQYQDARELSLYLAQSTQVRECFVDSYYRYASGHHADTLSQQDLAAVQTEFVSLGHIKTMIKALLLSEITLTRQDRSE